MKEWFKVLIICILLFTTIIPTVCASKIDTNLKEISEIQRIASTSTKGATFKEFVRGRISDLYVVGDFVSFYAKAVRGIGYISDGSSVFLFRHWYWKVSISYTGMNFRGILRQHFICGIFSGSI
jgi:hypothetical protein